VDLSACEFDVACEDSDFVSADEDVNVHMHVDVMLLVRTPIFSALMKM
jgi:hypothetical protein